MEFELPEAAKPFADFIIHVLIGATAFVIIMVIEVALAGCVKVIALLPIAPHWLVNAAEIGEQALFAFDALLFALFLIAEAIKLVRGFWKENQHG
jgi:hypothetical protein